MKVCLSLSLSGRLSSESQLTQATPRKDSNLSDTFVEVIGKKGSDDGVVTELSRCGPFVLPQLSCERAQLTREPRPVRSQNLGESIGAALCSRPSPLASPRGR